MALIRCPECGREKVSDTAEMCPECGYGIRAHIERVKIENERKRMEEEQRRKENEERKRREERNVIKLMALAPTGNQSKGNTSKTGDCFGGVFLQNGHDQ